MTFGNIEIFCHLADIDFAVVNQIALNDRKCLRHDRMQTLLTGSMCNADQRVEEFDKFKRTADALPGMIKLNGAAQDFDAVLPELSKIAAGNIFL